MTSIARVKKDNRFTPKKEYHNEAHAKNCNGPKNGLYDFEEKRDLDKILYNSQVTASHPKTIYFTTFSIITLHIDIIFSQINKKNSSKEGLENILQRYKTTEKHVIETKASLHSDNDTKTTQ